MWRPAIFPGLRNFKLASDTDKQILSPKIGDELYTDR
jgi:hypothetical protein